jgi:hypothetical protein
MQGNRKSIKDQQVQLLKSVKQGKLVADKTGSRFRKKN